MISRCTSALASGLVAMLVCGAALAVSPVGTPSAIACAPSKEQVAAVIVRGWVWETRDGGGSWRKMARLPEEIAEESVGDAGAGGPKPEEGVIPGREEGGVFTGGAGGDAEELPAGDGEEKEGFPGVALAVADDGRWAAAAEGELVTGGPGPGITGSREMEAVVGIVFDAAGNLWVVAGERLHAIAGGVVVGSWSVPGAGVPVVGRRGSALLVPGRDGIRIQKSSDPQSRPELVWSGSPEAVAFVGEGRRVAARRGRLLFMDDGGDEEEAEGFPFRVVELVAGAGGRIAAMDAGGNWWELEGRSARPAAFGAACLDAAGGLWTGTSSGPAAPSGEDLAWVGMDPRSMARVMAGAGRWIERNPGAPPCPPLPFNPLPAARLVAGFGAGGVLAYGVPAPDLVERSRTWFYVGIRLAWDLGPTDRAGCMARAQGWASRKAEALDRVARLWMSWRRARSRAEAARDPLEAFVSKNEVEEAVQLLRVTGGEAPAEKKE